MLLSEGSVQVRFFCHFLPAEAQTRSALATTGGGSVITLLSTPKAAVALHEAAVITLRCPNGYCTA